MTALAALSRSGSQRKARWSMLPADVPTRAIPCRGLALFARAVSTSEEALRIVPLPEAQPEMADMRTVVIVGSSLTRVIDRPGGPIVYTPRSAP